MKKSPLQPLTRRLNPTALALLCATGLAGAIQAQTPMLHYMFDNTGNNSGSLSGGNLTVSAIGTGTATYVPNGSPSGGNAALNMSSIYGSSTDYAIAQNSSDLNIGTLSQFTVTGWIKVTSYGNSIAPRLWNFNPTAGDAGGANSIYFALNEYTTTGNQVALDLRPNGVNLSLGGGGNNNSTRFTPDNWTFFAATFDSTGGGTLSYYLGDTVTAISSAGGGSGSIGSVNLGTAAYTSIGNRSNGQRGEPGVQMSDFRLYNSALDSTTLDNIRLEAVPEPGTAALAGLGIALTLLRFRRSRN